MNYLYILLLSFNFSSAQTFLDNRNWQLDESKSDEFNSTIIDSLKWSHQLWFDCSREVFLTGQNVSLENGFLKIKVKEGLVKKTKNHKRCYDSIYYKTTGAIISNFEIGYNSYIEVRAKVVDYRANLTSAIWLSDEPHKDKNPNLEIDIIETPKAKRHPNSFTSAMHIWYRNEKNESGGHVKLDGIKTRYKSKISKDFHVFGLERREDFIRMFIDGKLYWERNMLDFPEFLDQYRKLIINIEGNNERAKKGNYPKEFLIDYVRVYNYLENNR